MTLKVAKATVRNHFRIKLFSSIFVIVVFPSLQAAQSKELNVTNSTDRPHVAEYTRTTLQGWTILIDPALKDVQAEKPVAKSLKRLETNLAFIATVLPPGDIEKLHSTRIYLLGGTASKLSNKDNGLEYFQKNASRHHPHVRPEWDDAIVIYSASNYAGITEFWSRKALMHEFAHTWHLRQWPEKHPPIYDTWKYAIDKKLYLNAKRTDGTHVERAYALTNQLEYFAETSAMYFVGCDYYPFTKAELKTYDPKGYEMVERLWGVGK